MEHLTYSDILLRINQLETREENAIISRGRLTDQCKNILQQVNNNYNQIMGLFVRDDSHVERLDDIQKRLIVIENWISQNYPQDRAHENDSWLEIHKRILHIENKMPENGILKSTDYRLNRLESSSNCVTCKKINELLKEKDL